MCSAACAVFDKVSQPSFLHNVRHTGDLLKTQLLRLQSSHPDLVNDVCGVGLGPAVYTRLGDFVKGRLSFSCTSCGHILLFLRGAVHGPWVIGEESCPSHTQHVLICC